MSEALRRHLQQSGRFKNAVWEGRFQPIHVGHLAYIAELLRCAEHVWLWVVANEQSTEVVSDVAELPVPEFSREVDPHHRPEKNLLPFWLRYRLVVETLRYQFGPEAPITVSGGRRLDLAWDLYRKILPPERVFIVPERDSFEDIKAAAWQKLGERCFRMEVDHLPKVSGTLIRERVASGQSTDGLLSHYTASCLKREGYLQRLEEL